MLSCINVIGFQDSQKLLSGNHSMQLYYIRHAQSENNAMYARAGNNQGRSMDPNLTDTGRQQAIQLAQHLKKGQGIEFDDEIDFQNRSGYGLTHIYSSLMVRAVETGEIIASALGLPLYAWEEMHETGGIFYYDEETGEEIGHTGKNSVYYEENHPKLVLPDGMDEAGWWNRPFEPYEGRSQRARQVLQELIDRHGGSDDRVAFVSHGGFYNYLLMAVLGLLSKEGHWFLMNNAAISRIDFRDSKIVLVYQNRVDHLPAELIT